MLKTPEYVLEKKRIYYQLHKTVIEDKRRLRAPLVYLNKRIRLLTNEDAFSKEFMGNISRQFFPLKNYCELCLKNKNELDSQLCRFYIDGYDKYITLCRKCWNNKRKIN